MRVERIAKDKVRIFISFDDLDERGIDRDEIWKNGRKVQELFWDIMETAYVEVGFEVAGPIAIEAFTMPTEGVVVIVTRVPSLPASDVDEDDEDDEPPYETDPVSTFVFKFADLEDVIRGAYSVADYGVNARLFFYQDQYYLYCDEDSLPESQYEGLFALLSEYGQFSTTTLPVLDEYGTCVIASDAVEVLTERFSL